MDVVYNGLNSSLMMSLGAGALKVSGGPIRSNNLADPPAEIGKRS